MKGKRKPILRFVPCKHGGFNLGNSQLAPYELCVTCDWFEGESEDGLGIICSKDAKFSFSSLARGVKRKLGGLVTSVQAHHS